MNVKETLLKLISDNNSTQTHLATQLGYKYPSAISQIVQRGGMTVETLVKICGVYGYDVTIQPHSTSGKKPNGQIVITNDEPKKIPEK